MRTQTEKLLLSGVAADKYVGRADDVERLYLNTVSGAGPFRMRVSGSPGAGTSELLRKVYDRLFFEQRFVVPFFFSLRAGDVTAHAAAARYAYQFLLQAIAFRRNEPDLISAAPDICELAKLAPVADALWVERMCEVCRNDGPLNDERAFVRSALAAPMRAAAAAGMRVCVIVDDLHDAALLEGGAIFEDELSSLTANSRASLLVGIRRRHRFVDRSFELYKLNILDREQSSILIEILSAELGVTIGEQARDLIAVKFNGRLDLVRSLLSAARDRRVALDSFRDVEQLYVAELFNGGVGASFDDVFRNAAPDHTIRRKLIDALSSSIESAGSRFPVDVLRERIGASFDESNTLANVLETEEILVVENGFARLSSDGIVHDYLRARNGSEMGASNASSSALAVTNALKRAPRIMSRAYRSEASIGLEKMLSGFDIRVAPRGLVDYRMFRDRYKGVADEQLRMQIAAEDESVILPQIVHASPIVEYYPEFGEPIEPERAVVGVGFTDRSYRDEDQVAWLAVEIDSKLEADRAVTQEWCDRLDAAAAGIGYSNYKIWLIAPEGFSDGALDLIAERNGYGSSKRQVEHLQRFLNDDRAAVASSATEYEIVIPMGNETELIAAHTLEEIARRYAFPAKAVNQIKTALVEACINASEHSLSPDKKIYQKFAVDAEKIVITISNRGLRLMDAVAAKPALDNSPADSRRGWGLNLIRGLMDDVRIESVDDGTRIVMTKNISN
jgi:serine/threonine-protein kinase RsbW